MRSAEIVNTLVSLKQKSLSVNSRAQVITMSNGGELATGGGPYPVRALYENEWFYKADNELVCEDEGGSCVKGSGEGAYAATWTVLILVK